MSQLLTVTESSYGIFLKFQVLSLVMALVEGNWGTGTRKKRDWGGKCTGG